MIQEFYFFPCTGESLLEALILELKFIYSEKATKFCEISTLLLSNIVPVKSKVENTQNFAAFSEYMNFTVKTRMNLIFNYSKVYHIKILLLLRLY